MKKLFFFRSSSPNNGNSNRGSPPSTDKQVYWEMPLESGLNNQGGDKDKAEKSSQSPRGLFSRSRKQVHDSQGSSTSSCLRRSRSLSSAAFLADGLGQRNFSCTSDRSGSPSSSTSSTPYQQCDHSSR